VGKFEPLHFLKVWSVLNPKKQRNQF